MRQWPLTCPAAFGGPPCSGNTERSMYSGPPQSHSSSAGGGPGSVHKEEKNTETVTSLYQILQVEQLS